MGVLVDSQMHFEDFLNEIFETENNLTITTMSNTENKNVFAVLGVNTLEFDAENYTALNAAQIGLLNSALAAKETATESTANQKTIEELQAIVDETNQANAELKTSMDTMKSELDAVKQENEELSNSALSPKKVNPKGTTETKRIQGSMSIHEKMAVMKENYGSILK
jgi:small-conductance mechanosensitive channel